MEFIFVYLTVVTIYSGCAVRATIGRRPLS